MKKHFPTTFALLVWILFASSSAFAQNAPPPEKDKREADLIELIKLDKTIKLDIRYARADNFVGRAVYTEARAFLQKPAAEAVIRVHKKLKKLGLGLMIFDGYRPWSVTKLFWEATPEDKRKFVANPQTGSRHNRGCAVDLSIYDLKSKKLIDMPSDFDEFTMRASPDYRGASAIQTKNRDLLRKTMEAEGFTVNKNEWWHFDYKDWQDYAIYDISFEQAENLSVLQNFAESYQPKSTRQSVIPLPPATGEKATKAIALFAGRRAAEHQKYIALVFLRLYRFHLENFKQSYEIREIQAATKEDRTKPLTKEFLRLNNYENYLENEFIGSLLVIEFLQKNPQLLNYLPIKKEMERIETIETKMQKLK